MDAILVLPKPNVVPNKPIRGAFEKQQHRGQEFNQDHFSSMATTFLADSVIDIDGWDSSKNQVIIITVQVFVGDWSSSFFLHFNSAKGTY